MWVEEGDTPRVTARTTDTVATATAAATSITRRDLMASCLPEVRRPQRLGDPAGSPRLPQHGGDLADRFPLMLSKRADVPSPTKLANPSPHGHGRQYRPRESSTLEGIDTYCDGSSTLGKRRAEPRPLHDSDLRRVQSMDLSAVTRRENLTATLMIAAREAPNCWTLAAPHSHADVYPRTNPTLSLVTSVPRIPFRFPLVLALSGAVSVGNGERTIRTDMRST